MPIAKPDLVLSDTVDESAPSGKPGVGTATIATAGGTIASLALWVATVLGGLQKDVVRVESIQQAQAQQIVSVTSRVDKTETTLNELVKTTTRALAILEQMQRQDDRGAAK